MAQPLPYERDYDFTSYQTRHPSTPLPAFKLDAEFDQVAAVIDEVLLRIKDLQRDDLQLANRLVGYDQLKDELRNGFTTPTVWASGKRYALGAGVYVGRRVYAALSAHTSAADFNTDLVGGKWYLLADFTAVTQVDQSAIDAAAAAAQSAIDAANAALGVGAALTAAQTAAQASSDSAEEASGFAADAAASVVEAESVLASSVLKANNLSDLDDKLAAFDVLAPDGAGRVTMRKMSNDVRAAMLVNAMRAAENFGSGVSADGRTFVDLMHSVDTVNLAASANYHFKRGGIQPTSAPGAPADIAYGATTGNNAGWTGSTIATTIGSSALSAAQRGKEFFRATWRAGTGGALTIHGAFVGVYAHPTGGGPGFDPAYPVVPLLFSGAASGTASAGSTLVSDYAKFTVPEGKAIIVAYYVSDFGFVASKTQAGWTSDYKAVNEPAKFLKAGYTNTATTLGLERVEAASSVFTNVTVSSKALPLSATPSEIDLVAFVDCDLADISNLVIDISRDGASWKTLTLATLYSVNGRRVVADFGVDLTTGAGAGSALYWRFRSTGNKRVKVTALAISQDAGVFTDVPASTLRPSAPLVTHHMEATGLGYDTPPKYGRLWGFTQDWLISGPSRFHLKFFANLEHSGLPLADAPVMFTVPATATRAASIAALGAKPYVETDTVPATGNDSLKWLGFTTGNINNLSEHYKQGFINLTYDVEGPYDGGDGAVRFEIWGLSQTMIDSPMQPNRIFLNWEEGYGASAREFKYNRLEIIAEPLR